MCVCVHAHAHMLCTCTQVHVGEGVRGAQCGHYAIVSMERAEELVFFSPPSCGFQRLNSDFET